MTPELSAFAAANQDYEGTDVYAFLERVVWEMKDPDTIIRIGRAALFEGEQHQRIVVVPTASPEWEALTLSGYGRRVLPHESWIFTKTEGGMDRLLKKYAAALQRAGVLTEDVGPERPLTEEEEEAGLAKAGPCRILEFTARWIVCDPDQDSDAVPLTGLNVHEHLVGPDAPEEYDAETADEVHIENFAVELINGLDQDEEENP